MSKAGSHCHNCGGRDAENVCSGCTVAFYCSKRCQRADWRAGHKILCRGSPLQHKMHSVVRELFAAEWKWLNSGPHEYEEWDRCEDDEPPVIPLNHRFRAGEIAMVLARANPCVFVNNDRFPFFGEAYYNEVISPWYEKHREFLCEQAFNVEFISHGVHVKDQFCPCVKEDGTPCGNLQDFAVKGAVLVTDMRSPKIELVNKVFHTMRSQKVEEWDEGDDITMEDMIECLSFSLEKSGEMELDRGALTYSFAYPNKIFGREDDDYCCTQCFKGQHVIDPKDATNLAEHFVRAQKAMASIGFEIGFDLQNQEDWPDAEIARLWLHVAEGSFEVLDSWFEDNSMPFAVRVGSDRVEHIMELAHEVAVRVD